jgi:predicted metal-binding membrane protein
MSTTARRAALRPLALPQAGLAAVLVALAALAWWQTARQMGGMGPSGLELGGLGFFTGVWVLMMAAMMFP